MVDEFKSIRDNLFKALTGLAGGPADEDEDDGDDGARMDARTARALLQALFARAGKGKDEVVQIVAREIGMAVAAMLKEPLSQLAKHQKLQISFEFVPKTAQETAEADQDQADEEDMLEEPVHERTRGRKAERARGARRRGGDE